VETLQKKQSSSLDRGALDGRVLKFSSVLIQILSGLSALKVLVLLFVVKPQILHSKILH
jgi:hypothetical protein